VDERDRRPFGGPVPEPVGGRTEAGELAAGRVRRPVEEVDRPVEFLGGRHGLERALERFDREGVDPRERLDQPVGYPLAVGGVAKRLRELALEGDRRPVEVGHDEEGVAQDGLVVAEQDGVGRVHGRVPERPERLELPAEVTEGGRPPAPVVGTLDDVPPLAGLGRHGDGQVDAVLDDLRADDGLVQLRREERLEGRPVEVGVARTHGRPSPSRQIKTRSNPGSAPGR